VTRGGGKGLFKVRRGGRKRGKTEPLKKKKQEKTTLPRPRWKKERFMKEEKEKKERKLAGN